MSNLKPFRLGHAVTWKTVSKISNFKPFRRGHAVTWKTVSKISNLKPFRLFCPLRMSTWKDFYQLVSKLMFYAQSAGTVISGRSIKTHSIESIFVTGPSSILFAGVYVCTFQPVNLTGWSSEGVNYDLLSSFMFCLYVMQYCESHIKKG